MRSRYASFLLAGLCLALASCATRLEVTEVEGKTIEGRSKFFVERLEGEDSGLHVVIADEISALGFTAASGEAGQSTIPGATIVTYTDRWWWDMSPYLLELDIRFLEPDTRAMIVRGNSYRTSLARMKERAKVRRVLRAIFYGENLKN